MALLWVDRMAVDARGESVPHVPSVHTAAPSRIMHCSPPRGQSRTAATVSFAHVTARPSASQ